MYALRLAVAGVGLAILSAGVAMPASASTTAGTAMSVAKLNVSPRKVVGSAGQSLATVVTWTIADPDPTATTVSGTVAIRMQGSSPGTYLGVAHTVSFTYNQSTFGGVTFLSGTPQRSLYTYTFPIPRFANAASATWVVTEVTAQDDHGHTLDAGDKALGHFNRSVVNPAELVDATPPTFQGPALVVSNFNLQPFFYQNGNTVNVSYSLGVVDTESGFWKGSLTLAGPSGHTVQATFAAGDPSGQCPLITPESCQIALALPPGTAPGTWSVSTISLTDNVGNSQTYGGLHAGPFVLTSDSVVNAQDFTVVPNPVDDWMGPAAGRLSLSVTGAQQGVSAVYVTFNPFSFGCSQQSTTPTVAADGSVSVPMQLSPGFSGCLVSGIAVVDGAGNVSVYGPDFNAPDPRLRITELPDTIAPTVSAASLNKTSIPVSGLATANLEVDATVVTPIAPVDSFSTALYDSAGNPVPGAGLFGGLPQVANGPTQLPVFLPSNLAPGTYTVGFSVSDAGNLTTRYGAPNQQPVPGGPLTVTITP